MTTYSIGELSELHATTIGRVGVGFVFTAADLNPDEITGAIEIDADSIGTKGARDTGGVFVNPYDKGFWRLDTNNKVFSKDINDHFNYLLVQLLPHKDFFVDIKRRLGGEILFDVLWESNYLYAGSGPMISSFSINGIAEFDGELAFDIYQIDSDDE